MQIVEQLECQAQCAGDAVCIRRVKRLKRIAAGLGLALLVLVLGVGHLHADGAAAHDVALSKAVPTHD